MLCSSRRSFSRLLLRRRTPACPSNSVHISHASPAAPRRAPPAGPSNVALLPGTSPAIPRRPPADLSNPVPACLFDATSVAVPRQTTTDRWNPARLPGAPSSAALCPFFGSSRHLGTSSALAPLKPPSCGDSQLSPVNCQHREEEDSYGHSRAEAEAEAEAEEEEEEEEDDDDDHDDHEDDSHGHSQEEGEGEGEEGYAQLVDALHSALSEPAERNLDKTLAPFNGKITPRAFSSVLGRKLSPTLALRFSEWASRQQGFSHTEGSYKSLVALLCKKRKWKAVWKVLANVSGGSGSSIANTLFMLVIQKMGKAREFTRIMEALSRREEFGVAPTVPLFTSSVKLLLQGGLTPEAEHLYKEMESAGLKADRFMYQAIVSGFARAGSLEKALHAFRQMRVSGYPPSPGTLKALFDGLTDRGRFEEGRKFFRELLDAGCIPDTYPASMLACAFHGEEGIRAASKTLQIMREKKGILFHAASYNSVLKVLVDSGKKEDAFHFFRKMSGNMDEIGRRKVPNMSSYRILIGGLSSSGELTSALEYFREMWVIGLLPTREIYDTLLLHLSRAGRVEEIIYLLDFVEKFHVTLSDEVQKLTFRALRKSKGLDKTLKLFRKLKGRGCLGKTTDFSQWL